MCGRWRRGRRRRLALRIRGVARDHVAHRCSTDPRPSFGYTPSAFRRCQWRNRGGLVRAGEFRTNESAIQPGPRGLPAIAQAALRSQGGRLIICMPSSAKQGTVSRIVPSLSQDTIRPVPRYLSDAVVTEHRIAGLRGLTLRALPLAALRSA